MSSSGAMGMTLPLLAGQRHSTTRRQECSSDPGCLNRALHPLQAEKGWERYHKGCHAIGLVQWRNHSAHHLCRRRLRRNAAAIGHWSHGGEVSDSLAIGFLPMAFSAHIPDSHGAGIRYRGHDNLGGNISAHGNPGGFGISSPLPGHGHWIWIQALSLDE